MCARTSFDGGAREFGAPKTEAKPQRILYATDFSPESEPAMHCACSLAKEYNAALFFLHVTEDV